MNIPSPAADETPLDVTQPDAPVQRPYTDRPDIPAGDPWLEALTLDEVRVSVYADSAGRTMRLTHPGLIPPAAITMSEGVPASPVEFLLKGDEP